MHDREEQAIRERIEETRARMGDTIEEIGDRVNPDRVKSELKARAREQVDEIKTNVKQKARTTMRNVEHEVSETGRGLWATIKDNPVPAGMVGIGLAWLVANRSESSKYPAGVYRGYDAQYRSGRDIGYADAGYGHAGYSTGTAGAYGSAGYAGSRHAWDESQHEHRGAEAGSMRASAEDAADRARERAADAVDNVRDKAGQAADSVRHRAEEAVDSVREHASHVADRAHHTVDNAHYYAARAERRVEYAVQENPVAAGAMAMALGLAAGLMVPETRREHELMGRTRDRMLERASEAAHRAGERVREEASEKLGDSAKRFVDSALQSEDSGSSTGGYSEPRR